MELCAVFSNLLDNALNACAQSPDGERRIEAAARLWGMYLVIDVENSYLRSKGQAETVGCSPSGDAGSRRDAASPFPDLSMSHGWGRGIVREVVRRHDGTFEAGVVDDVYRVRAILKQDRAVRDGGDGEWSR